MAVTSLWHIKGELKDLIDYVENPDKTVPERCKDFFNVFDYMRRSDKTRDEYVSAVNCLKSTALRQMILTKRQFGQRDGYIAWHGYQSFKIGEITPDTAHEIGVKLAKEMWGDRFQIVVTTHLDKQHIHNHFAFNSVSFKDGKKYNYSKAELQRLRDTSDRLCREYGLSIVQHPHKAPSRPVWLDEKAGKPTRYNVYRKDVRDAINFSRTPKYMEGYLNRLGYLTNFTGKHWRLRLPQYEHYTRLDTLDERWTPDEIIRSMGYYARFGSHRATVSFSPFMPESIKGAYIPYQRTGLLYGLFLYFSYEIGVLPKNTEYKPTSPYLKEAWRQIDQITAQVTYMAQNNIATMDDLLADREELEAGLTRLTTLRTKLQNKIRRATPEEKIKLREQKAAVTAEITAIRKKLKCNHGIEQRSTDIQDTLDRVYDNEVRSQQLQQQSKSRNERNYER